MHLVNFCVCFQKHKAEIAKLKEENSKRKGEELADSSKRRKTEFYETASNELKCSICDELFIEVGMAFLESNVCNLEFLDFFCLPIVLLFEANLIWLKMPFNWLCIFSASDSWPVWPRLLPSLHRSVGEAVPGQRQEKGSQLSGL